MADEDSEIDLFALVVHAGPRRLPAVAFAPADENRDSELVIRHRDAPIIVNGASVRATFFCHFCSL